MRNVDINKSFSCGNVLMKKLRSNMHRVLIALALMISGSALAADSAIVNLVVSDAGMYRISYSELKAKGADLAGLRHSKLSIRSNGQNIPVLTKGQDAGNGAKRLFGEGGYIQFYAGTPDSLYSTEQAYTVHYGLRRAKFDKQTVRFDKNATYSDQYEFTKSFEENNYYDYIASSETDPWHFGTTFVYKPGDTKSKSVNFDLEGLVGGTADINVEVYGLRDTLTEENDHHIVAKVNGTEIGDEQFDGFTAHTMELENVPVNATANDFTLYARSISTVPFDAIGLNKVEVRYPRMASAKADYLEGFFSAAQAKASEFSDNTARVYRIEEDGGVTSILRTKRYPGAIGFNTDGVAGNYVVVANGGYKKLKTDVDNVVPLNDNADISSGSAEYLIIANKAFMGSELDELVELRSQEYSVKVVDVDQVYGQYGNHLPSADAIQNYINFAAANLDTRFVVLVGSDTYDYKQHVTDSVSFVPTRYVSTPGGGLQVTQTPSDAVYGDLDNDNVPDIPVGRLSVRTSEELGFIVEKLRDYQEREEYAGRILIAGDKEDVGNGISFTDDVNDMIAAIPSDWRSFVRSDFRALPDVDGDQAAHDKIINAINAGVAVTAYIGHSSQQVWARTNPKLLQTNEIAGFSNINKPTLVTQWGCWNAYFVDPAGNNMADVFLVNGLNGAATVLGASTLTTAAGERILGIELNKRMYNPGITIGEAVIQAKQAFAQVKPGGVDILLGWQIIGDPALKVNP
jgi:hypothetical protein